MLLVLAAFLGLVRLNNTSLFSAGDDRPLLIDYSMAELRALDIGYGYYTDSNEYPLRGNGIGLMPSLEEVLDRFPHKGFLIDVKSNDRNEAVRLGTVGLPHRFVARMRSVDTMVILTHPYQTESTHDLPETPEYAELIPRGYGGAIQTNRIDKFQDWLAESR